MLSSKPLRKKGGIFIKKILVFLILFSAFLGIKNVQAESASFYEAEYIDGIYMNKHQYSARTIYFQKARFFRKTGTNEFAYCIEPFSFFEDYSSYESTIHPDNLTKNQLQRISRIAYFGYGYQNHSDPKWYAITQMMIWKESDPNGDYYFTDSLNGNRISIYQEEMNEINHLVDSMNTIPSFSNQTYSTIVGKPITLTDTNHVLSLFEFESVKTKGNQITLSYDKPGSYEYTLKKEYQNYQTPYLFYQSHNSQNLIQTGNLEKLETKVKVNVIETSLEISKIDQDTKSIIPSGEGVLDGAKYMLYDENDQEIQELVIKENQALIKNLDFGTYYLKEIEAGIGYTINPNLTKITISQENPKVSLVLENKIIEKEITIEKKYGEKDTYQSEKNITFQIWNDKEEMIKTVTTNEEGIVQIKLPYGTYQFIQQNTTEGYHKVEPITLKVENQEEEYLLLKDMKIEVPDTHTKRVSFLLILLHWFFL